VITAMRKRTEQRGVMAATERPKRQGVGRAAAKSKNNDLRAGVLAAEVARLLKVRPMVGFFGGRRCLLFMSKTGCFRGVAVEAEAGNREDCVMLSSKKFVGNLGGGG